MNRNNRRHNHHILTIQQERAHVFPTTIAIAHFQIKQQNKNYNKQKQ